jgi:hypothetical protein
LDNKKMNLQVELMNAIEISDLERVMEVLSLGVDLRLHESFIPLHNASMVKPKIFLALLYYGLDLFEWVEGHKNALYWVVREGRTDIINILFKIGYLDPEIHHNQIKIALKYTKDKCTKATMLKKFINRGFQGRSFVPAYAYNHYENLQPSPAFDKSSILSYFEIKKNKRVYVESPELSPRQQK